MRKIPLKRNCPTKKLRLRKSIKRFAISAVFLLVTRDIPTTVRYDTRTNLIPMKGAKPMAILTNKKIAILGDRDGIPGPAIEACVATVAGAEVVFSTTECFV